MYVIYSLENCPYSNRANKIFKGKGKIIPIKQEEKHNYKKLMKSFPQIYYITKNDASLIGGIDDFETMIQSNRPQFRIEPQKFSTIEKIKKTFKNFDI